MSRMQRGALSFRSSSSLPHRCASESDLDLQPASFFHWLVSSQYSWCCRRTTFKRLLTASLLSQKGWPDSLKLLSQQCACQSSIKPHSSCLNSSRYGAVTARVQRLWLAWTASLSAIISVKQGSACSILSQALLLRSGQSTQPHG